MKVLSLFDGMSCGRVALESLQKKVDVYYASEIDVFAIKNTQHNFPDTIQLGDIRGWRDWNIDWDGIDLVLAGSPCQGFSSLGRKKGLHDERSGLVFVFFDILNHVMSKNPNVKFLLENVKMDTNIESIISNALGVEPITINSKLVSAQNRVRMYWTNINNGRIPQPVDRGLLLKDVIMTNVDSRYFLTKYTTHRIMTEYPSSAKSVLDKSRCLTTGCGRNVGGRGSYLVQNGGIRRLTVRECARLQTIPEEYEFVVPEGKAYKLIGNGWTVEVIKHILSYA
jgi:cytosine-specific methyltransferase